MDATRQQISRKIDRAAGAFGCISARTGPDTLARQRVHFEQVHACPPELTLETPSFSIALGMAPGVTLGADPMKRVTVVLTGDVLLEDCRTADDVAIRYLSMGDRFARDLNGTWSALVVDRVMDRVCMVTDRLGTWRIYHGIRDGCHWIGNDLSALPVERFRIDPLGVAWYLTLGAGHAGHTPYAGLNTLPAASLTDLTPTSVRSVRYWDPSRDPGLGPFSDREMEHELRRRLRAAIRRSLLGEPAVVLSLSGGRGSAVMAGMLRDAGPVRSFSYGRGREEQGSDAHVARQLARSFGFEHRFYQGYWGAMVPHLRHNAALGLGTAGPTDEVHAWAALSEDLEGSATSVLFVGDHDLDGSRTRRAVLRQSTRTRNDCLRSLSWLTPMLPRGVARVLVDGLRSELDQAFPERASAEEDFRSRRFPDAIVPWRRQFPGRFMPVRWPLLDYELLDWTQLLSRRQRSSGLFRRTVEQAFPHAFAVGRPRVADTSFDIRGECRGQIRQITAAATERPSRVDAVLPSDLPVRMMARVLRESLWRRRVSRPVRRCLHSTRAAVARVFPVPRVGAVPARYRVLRNYLTLREALSDQPGA